MRPFSQTRLLVMLAALVLWGCSNANEGAVGLDPTGKHQVGWIGIHATTYLKDAGSCKGCHGASLTGGISGVSCFSSSFAGSSCHANGPHPVPWKAHSLSSNQLNNCSPCHGALLQGSGSAPSCASCHKQLAPGSVPLSGTCVSCHGNPPNGAVFPNISGVHSAHVSHAIPCGACHAGGGSGAASHGSVMTVSIASGYNGTTGNAAYNADGSCSNISCHGGSTTPKWRGGRIAVTSQCTFCHAAGSAPGLPQANSYYSGQHGTHLQDVGLVCIDCHDMSVVSGTAAHFSGLGSPAFELAPAATLRLPLNYNNAVRSCTPGGTPPAGSFSVGICHGVRSW